MLLSITCWYCKKKRSGIRINYRVNLRSNNNNFVHKSVQIRNRRRNSWWNGDEEDLFFTFVSEVKTSYKAFGGNIPAEFRKWYGPNTNMFDIASFVEFLFLLHNNQSIQRDLMSNYRWTSFSSVTFAFHWTVFWPTKSLTSDKGSLIFIWNDANPLKLHVNDVNIDHKRPFFLHLNCINYLRRQL